MKISNKISLGAVAALSLAYPVYAQDAAATTTSAAASVLPTPITGTVLRYYVDRAGFVSAVDVQTTDGIRMVGFSPAWAQKLSTLYPVGGTLTGYVTTTSTNGVTGYYLVGATDKMPVPGALQLPDGITDIDILKSSPFTTIGAKPERFSGKITGYIAAPKSGEVLALIVDDTTLVRVPQENRLSGPMNAPEGITPIYSDSFVDGYAYPEAPRYGIVSPFSKRLIATGISVDGHALGALGFGTHSKSKYGSKWVASAVSDQEKAAKNWGYYTYPITPAAPVSP